MPGNGIARIQRTRERITGSGLNASAATLLPTGSVLFSSRATIGKLAIAEVPLATNQGFVAFVPSAQITSEFLAYALLAYTDAITELAGSTTFKEITRSSLRDFMIPVPSLAEQKRTVMALKEGEALRCLRARADSRANEIIGSYFNAMFGDPLRNPKKWRCMPVSQFVRRFQGGRSVAPAGDEGITTKNRILKVSAVTWGRFAPGESKPVPDSYVPVADQFVREGDLLFSRANTTELVGATVMVDATPPNLLLPDKLWRFVWTEEVRVEPRFVLSLFQHPSVRRELGARSSGTGGSMKNISMEKVMSMALPIPPIDLQRTFAKCVEKINNLRAAQERSRIHIENLFESVLGRAFQGKLLPRESGGQKRQ